MKIMGVKAKKIPKELRQRHQWVAWRSEVKEDGKISKIPVNPKTGRNASTSDSETWGTYKKAYRYYRKHKAEGIRGIGFVLTTDDPFIGIDLDHCRNSKTGEIELWAKEIIRRVGSYAEISPSGKGVRIIVKGKLPQGGRKKGNIELYDGGRYVTITGQHLKGTPPKIKKKPNTIKKLHNEIFKKEEMVNPPRETPVSPLLTDEEIIERALAASNGDKFAKLMKGDWSDYKSQSQGDLALCSMLAFWTGRDRARMDRLFKQSGLMRRKWNEVHSSDGWSYGEMSLDQALASCKEVYDPDPIQRVINKLPDILDSCKADPKKAALNILNDKGLLKDLAILSTKDNPNYEKFLMELKQFVPIRDVELLKRAVNAEKKNLRNSALDRQSKMPLVSVKSCLPDAPVSGEFLVPKGWSISPQGVFKDKFDKKTQETWKEEMSRNPVLIQGRLKNMVDGSEDLRMAWFRDNKWEFRIVDRGEIAEAKLITKLAEYGFPVNSETARGMVKYLAEFEAVNSLFLPRATVTHKLGWQGERGELGFLWGRNLITAEGKLLANMRIEKIAPGEWPQNLVFFRGHDRGEEQIADAFYKRGTLKGWNRVIPLITPYPLVTFGFYVSLAAPVIFILGADPFIVDWANRTSTGKTTTLKIGASIWGNYKSLVKSWDATRVSLERNSIVLQSLPFIIDETKRAKSNELVTKFLYDFASGQGRGRGSIQGMRETGSWLTVALTCGEAKIVNFSTGDGGSHARVLSIWGSPFGKKSKKKAEHIRKIIRIIRRNYGHAGYRFVQYLIKNKERWQEWRKRYSELIKLYQDQAGSNEVALRQAEYLAVIHLTAILARKALGLSINYQRHLKRVSRKIMGEVSEADRAKEARELVLSWAASQQDSFWRPDSDNKQPNQGWLGVWDPDGTGQQIAVIPHHLHKCLKDGGYEPKGTIRTWKDMKWLETKGERKGLTKKVRLDEERPRCYILHRKSKLGSAVGRGKNDELTKEFNDIQET